MGRRSRLSSSGDQPPTTSRSTSPFPTTPIHQSSAYAAFLRASRTALTRYSLQASIGTVHYVPEKSAFVWKIKQLAGGKEYLMRAHFGLPSVRGGAYGMPPCPKRSLTLVIARRRGRQACTHLDQVRDSLLHRQRDRRCVLLVTRCAQQANLALCSAIPQDCGEVWLPSSAMGPIQYVSFVWLRAGACTDSPVAPQVTQHGDDYSLRTNQQAAKQANPSAF